ncbi:MAG TPA: aminodeoxychorismate synthase component I [Baekduia sp.]|nr:aminodeoxychorismate synthase component I [Baekduia sp.]
MRPVREPLAGGLAAHEAVRLLRGAAHAVALSGAWAHRSTVLARDPLRVAGPQEDPFAVVDDPGALPAAADGVYGGWLGFLGFGLGRRLEPVPPQPPRPVALPPFALGFYDHVVRRDGSGQWWFEALWTPERAPALRAARDRWAAQLAAPAPAARPAGGALAPVAPGGTGHRAAVAACRERIAAGEVFQANLCLRLEGALEGDALDLWSAGVAALEPAYAAYVAGPWGALAGLSPELFLRRRGREVVSEPIKGTAAEARGAREALAASAKDRAENVMIADLVRNDLGRVCAYGTVEAAELAVPRPAPGVWHLVSTVRGTLREDATDGDLLRASFPPGSVTGAPKVQALRVIHELEATAREAYCGAAGFVSPVAGLELNVAIRTFEAAQGRVWLGAGGGVVWDSTPEAELAEALAKAAPLARAVGLQLADASSGVLTLGYRGNAPLDDPGGLPWALAEGRDRPDPALGLLETVAVRGGMPVALEEHLARLAASVAALGLPAPPAGLAERVRRAAAHPGAGRVRVVHREDATVVEPGPSAPGAAQALTLRPWLLPGGLGAHKWADRRLLDALAADGTTPLLVDLDGQVLEAGHAAVVAVCDGVLVAPPLDGRRLPSVSGAAFLRDDGRPVDLRPLTLDDLAAADELILTSALRGAHPARLSRVPATR